MVKESITDLNSHLKISHKGLTKNVIGKVGSESYLYGPNDYKIYVSKH